MVVNIYIKQKNNYPNAKAYKGSASIEATKFNYLYLYEVVRKCVGL